MKRLLLIGLALAPLLFCSCASEDKGTGKGKPQSAPAGPNPIVVIKTSMGTIKAELFADKSPDTVKNFLTYVDDKHYDGTVFHRVMPDFMIQGGGFKKGLNRVRMPEQLKDYEKPTGAGIVNEARINGLSNTRGTLAMARMGDPNSATAQFFINVADNDGSVKYNLNPGGVNPHGYAVFGKVIDGMAVVDKIKAVRTKTLFPKFSDVPVTDVVIESIRRADK
jgi:cyclophilin family peptidyl-prolyl cis-trans isomerase